MTDPTHDPHAALDELASAHLDGQTSAEEARQVAADPALLARMERLRQVRDAVRMPDVPVDAARREVAIAAALSAGTELLPAAVAPVGDLAAARGRRSVRRRWIPLVGIAAAIGLAALLVPQLGDDGGRDATVASDRATIDRRLEDREVSTEDRDTQGDGGDARPRSTPSSHARGTEADPGAPAAGGTAAGATATEGDTSESTTGGASMTTTTTTTAGPFAASAPRERTLLDLGAFEDGDRQQLVAAARTAADDPGTAEAAEPTKARRAEIDSCLAPMEAVAADEGASVLYAAVAAMGKAGNQTTVVGIAVELDGSRELRTRYLEDCERWFEASLDEPRAEG